MPHELNLFSISIFLGFTTALVVWGLAHVKRFPGIDEGLPAAGSPLSVEDLERCADRLVGFMKKERPHLDPGLGRASDSQITVADLTGVAVQDIQISKLVYQVLINR